MRRPFAAEVDTRRRALQALVAAILFGCGLAGGAGAQGRALEGVDEVQALAPPAASVAPYENEGYRLWIEDGVVRVRVDNAHLGSVAPFQPRVGGGDELQVLASRLTGHSSTVYEATSAVLSWIARNVRYDLDRQQAQSATAVLERRSGYCTGIARLAVELLRAVEIEAREVAGYVFGDEPGRVEGFHRWIEVYYPDRGWAFSDPSTSHHFVPATYVRLASDRLDLSRSAEGLLLGRSKRLRPRDVVLDAPQHVVARKNHDRQNAGALLVTVEGASEGEARLAGPESTYRAPLRRGSVSFLGLSPGPYRLQVKLRNGEVLERRLRLLKRIRADIAMRAALPVRSADR